MTTADLQTTVVIHPSPILIATPLLPATALFFGGAVRGVLDSPHSIPALVLLVSAYLISRWYRCSALILGQETISFRGQTIRYDEISIVKRETGTTGRHRIESLNFYDLNNMIRLVVPPAAYGTGQVDIYRILASHLPAGALVPSLEHVTGRRIYIVWAVVLLITLLSFIESVGGWGI